MTEVATRMIQKFMPCPALAFAIGLQGSAARSHQAMGLINGWKIGAKATAER